MNMLETTRLDLEKEAEVYRKRLQESNRGTIRQYVYDPMFNTIIHSPSDNEILRQIEATLNDSSMWILKIKHD